MVLSRAFKRTSTRLIILVAVVIVIVIIPLLGYVSSGRDSAKMALYRVWTAETPEVAAMLRSQDPEVVSSGLFSAHQARYELEFPEEMTEAISELVLSEVPLSPLAEASLSTIVEDNRSAIAHEVACIIMSRWERGVPWDRLWFALKSTRYSRYADLLGMPEIAERDADSGEQRIFLKAIKEVCSTEH